MRVRLLLADEAVCAPLGPWLWRAPIARSMLAVPRGQVLAQRIPGDGQAQLPLALTPAWP